MKKSKEEKTNLNEEKNETQNKTKLSKKKKYTPITILNNLLNKTNNLNNYFTKWKLLTFFEDENETIINKTTTVIKKRVNIKEKQLLNLKNKKNTIIKIILKKNNQLFNYFFNKWKNKIKTKKIKKKKNKFDKNRKIS